jgi:hypothetical protein
MSSRVVVSFSQDSQRSADARVRMKIAAVAYADASHLGDPELAGAGLAAMCEAAMRWYWSFAGSSQIGIGSRPLASPESARELNRLRLAALGYACSRHGSDACIELSRDALHALCDAAIAYCQAVLSGAEPATQGDHADRVLRIDA